MLLRPAHTSAAVSMDTANTNVTLPQTFLNSACTSELEIMGNEFEIKLQNPKNARQNELHI